MITVSCVYDFLNEIAPFDCQEEWDNSGLLIGDGDNEVEKIAVVLDVNLSTVEQAIACGADLIISHHPVIFKPVKNFLADSIAYQLAINNISVISSHTCFDSAAGGVNDILCEKLGINKVSVIDVGKTKTPLLRAGFIEKMSSEAFAEHVACQLGANIVFADAGNDIETVAVCSGAGDDFIDDVIDSGIDAYVTGEAGYHDLTDAAQHGLTVIAAGHFETEKPAMEMLKNILSKKFPDVEMIEINENSPLKYM